MGGGWVDTILTWLFVFIGMIMTFFILLQEGKGGGLAALGGTKAAGVEGVTNPIRRATAYLAGLFFILAIILGIMHKPKESIGLGSETPAVVPAPGAGAVLNPTPVANPNNVVKVTPPTPPEGAVKTDKPAEGAKTDAPKTGDKPAEAPKTDETKPVETPKADATKPIEAPKGDATKPAEPPKPDAAKPADK